MIHVNQFSKIYVHCPAGIVSGGAELLHQLVSYLRDNNRDAYIVYYGNFKHEIPTDYNKYNIACTDKIEDIDNNIEVIFEACFNKIFLNKNTQKILWWLSVDNFYRCSYSYLTINNIMRWSVKDGIKILCKKIYYLLIKRKNLFKNTLSLKKLSKLNFINAYQSEYAQNYLQNAGFKQTIALKDYINTEHCNSSSIENKENIVLYNPKKGLKYTQKLIKLSPHLNWIPIENMSRKEVIELMKRAKVYVDFGFHPGKDRLPRECAMNGCCIITGRKGSANFYEDVPIKNKYKFNEKKSSKKDIIKLIEWILNNYKTALKDFDFYRHSISLEKKEFENQISNIFLRN